jgi:hypothetical protein
MSLLERYLLALRPLLPQQGREDILRELSDNILSQMEEKQEELGRPLTDSEQAEVIKRHGHPVVAAARYGKRHYLIGPDWFPFYWLILRLAGATALVIRTIIALVTVLSGPNSSEALASALVEIPFVLVPVFCWVTAVFVAFEWFAPNLPCSGQASWSPQSLPIKGAQFRAIPRPNSVAEVAFGTIAALWWAAVPGAPWLILGPGVNFMNLAPIWTTLHWPVLLLTIAGVLQAWVNLFRPELTRTRAAVRLIALTASFAVGCVLLAAGYWVIPITGVSGAPAVAAIVNRVVLTCIAAGLMISGGMLVWECVQYFRGTLVGSSLRMAPRS